MKETSYADVVDQLTRADVPLRQLSGEGNVAVTLAAGRIVAMAFSPQGPNLLWSNPELGNVELVKTSPEQLVGGLGGDRLWFAPELSYHWDGKPDWQSFANYKVPKASDPGDYEFTDQDRDHITLNAKAELREHGSERTVAFEVTRVIRLAAPPLPRTDALMKDIDYVGIETSHELRIAPGSNAGLIDLWHLLQIPVDSALIVPIKQGTDREKAEPLSYGLPGDWREKPDHILWRYGGEARAKFGLPAEALTGRCAVLRRLGPDRWCLIVRQFPVDAEARYGDHPHGSPRSDQAFQAWDGFGFGEMEFHSPVLDAAKGPRQLSQCDQLWALGGNATSIAALAERLLGVDARYLLSS